MLELWRTWLNSYENFNTCWDDIVDSNEKDADKLVLPKHDDKVNTVVSIEKIVTIQPSKSWIEKYVLPVCTGLAISSGIMMVATLGLLATKVLSKSFLPLVYVDVSIFSVTAIVNIGLEAYFSEKNIQNKNSKLNFTMPQYAHSDKKQNSLYLSEVNPKNVAVLVSINNDLLTEINKEETLPPLVEKTVTPKLGVNV